jgi:plasmid replication initiation protein
MTVHKFNSSLKVGQNGEEIFLALNPNITRLSGLKADFVSSKTNTKYELKTDTYDMTKTKNFFIERWSKPGKVGGPWQAKQSGSHVYVYFFIQNYIAFFFNIDKLLAKLETLNLDVDFKLCSVQNEGYTTQGYKIPRELLEDVLMKKVVYEY